MTFTSPVRCGCIQIERSYKVTRGSFTLHRTLHTPGSPPVWSVLLRTPGIDLCDLYKFSTLWLYPDREIIQGYTGILHFTQNSAHIWITTGLVRDKRTSPSPKHVVVCFSIISIKFLLEYLKPCTVFMQQVLVNLPRNCPLMQVVGAKWGLMVHRVALCH